MRRFVVGTRLVPREHQPARCCNALGLLRTPPGPEGAGQRRPLESRKTPYPGVYPVCHRPWESRTPGGIPTSRRPRGGRLKQANRRSRATQSEHFHLVPRKAKMSCFRAGAGRRRGCAKRSRGRSYRQHLNPISTSAALAALPPPPPTPANASTGAARPRAYATPFEKLRKLLGVAEFLRSGVALAELERAVTAACDIQAARALQAANARLRAAIQPEQCKWKSLHCGTSAFAPHGGGGSVFHPKKPVGPSTDLSCSLLDWKMLGGHRSEPSSA